jgi:DNA-binding PadR family transcriptional regulator
MADTLGSFEQAVLLAIIRLDDGAYGRAILNEVAARLDRDVTAGAVQATLDRLERKSLVRSTLGSGTAIRDGRARRFYTVSDKGLEALNDARRTHDTIWRGFARPLKSRS